MSSGNLMTNPAEGLLHRLGIRITIAIVNINTLQWSRIHNGID
jgi:hypothetical protein